MDKKKARKGLLKLGALGALGVVFPPAAVGVAAAVALKSARKYAQSGDPKDARGMVSGYDDLASDDD